MSDEQPNIPPAIQGKPTPPVATRFRRGQSGNPGGRPPNAGLSWKEMVNHLCHLPAADVQATADDEEATVIERSAAKEAMRMMSDQLTNAGCPIAGASTDRVLDRLIGKPQSTINLNQDPALSLPDVQISKMSLERLKFIVESLGLSNESTAVADVVPALPSPLPAVPEKRE